MADDLKQDKTDALVATAKSVLGVVPFAGTLLSELVGNLIPNQRVDGLTKYVKELEVRLSRIDREKIDNALRSEEGIDLFEEGFVQASWTAQWPRWGFLRVAASTNNSFKPKPLRGSA